MKKLIFLTTISLFFTGCSLFEKENPDRYRILPELVIPDGLVKPQVDKNFMYLLDTNKEPLG
jgi:hypothetical protein